MSLDDDLLTPDSEMSHNAIRIGFARAYSRANGLGGRVPAVLPGDRGEDYHGQGLVRHVNHSGP